MKKIFYVVLLSANYLYSPRENIHSKLQAMREARSLAALSDRKIVLYTSDHPADQVKRYDTVADKANIDLGCFDSAISRDNMPRDIVRVVMSVIPTAGQALRSIEEYNALGLVMSSVLDDAGCLTVLCKNTNFPELHNMSINIIIPNK